VREEAESRMRTRRVWRREGSGVGVLGSRERGRGRGERWEFARWVDWRRE